MWKHSNYLYEKALEKSRERKGKTMCAKLDELKGISAEDILIRAGQEWAVPVDMDKVVETLGLYKEARDFSDIQEIEGGEKISGLVVLMDNDVKIFFNTNDSLAEKRFTAAHEIGHCCLHGGSLKNDYIEFLHNDGFADEHETEASIFAARLLIPKKSLKMVYDELLEPTISGLAEIFQTPKSIMEFRLKEDGLEIEFEGMKNEERDRRYYQSIEEQAN